MAPTSPKLRTVYRVENSHQEGPYRAKHTDTIYKLPGKTCSRLAERPTLADGGMLDDPWDPFHHLVRAKSTKQVLFGFKSKRQLLKWFTANDQRLLAELGFKVVAYQVPDSHVVADRNQCIFHRRHAIRVKHELRTDPG